MVRQEDPFGCGAACVRQLLRERDIEVSEAELRERCCFVEAEGTRAEDMARVLRELSPGRWEGGTVERDAIGAIAEHFAPFLAMLDHHWVIVDALGASEVRLRDPHDAAEVALPLSTFLDAWDLGLWRVVFEKPGRGR